MFRIALLLLTALSLIAETPTQAKKLSEIDQRIAALQTEIAGLTALRASIASGQLPDSAVAIINVAASSQPAAISTPTPAVTRAVVAPPTSKPAPSSQYILGPRGGCYTLTSGGNKRYVDRSMCQ